MSGGLEMIAGAVVQRVAGMLGDAAWERIKLLWNFKGDVQEMKIRMGDLKVVLNYADKRSRETDDEPVHHWLKKYKYVAYDIEDALDELKADAMIWENSPCKVKLFFSSFNPLVVGITMSNKMRNIRLKLDKIVDEQKIFNFLSSPISTGQDDNVKWRETYVHDTEKIEMVGREREKKELITKVLQEPRDKESFIIPIVGLGGMGKTTIAKYAFTAKEVIDKFDVKAWVHVSMDFDLRKIITAIIYQVEGRTPPSKTLQVLVSQLDSILAGKLYLIVLDDLWEEERSNLEELMNMLKSGNVGSKIIVTTRKENIATTLSIICSPYFYTVEPIKLEDLSTDECWCIMKPPNLENGQVIDLVDIGKEIALRCSGIPLVAKALGYVMRKHCTREAWSEIRRSDILDIKGDNKRILKGLMLSYYQLPPELKLCFMYCSIFPKNYDIDHDRLIQQWVALGFIQDSDGQPLQKIGKEYVDVFLGMSFLTILTSPTVSLTASIFKPTLKLRMHDMVHDVARYVAGDEFSYTKGVANRNAKRGKLNCQYHLLINQSEISSAYKDFPAKVRALHSMACEKMCLPKQAFSHTLCLRVLDLSGCHVSELPSSIYQLKLLRYLDASTLPISSLSKSLNQLVNLQTLILSNTNLNTLPTNIGCLQNLQYFDLSGCANLSELPFSFGNLSALLFLNLANCHEVQTLPKSFGDLHSLQFLSLSDCHRLHTLPESCCQLCDLTYFDLSDCHSLGKLPDCIGNLSKLEYLNITSCSKIQVLPESLCKLVMLKHLNLSFCVKLEHLPSCIGELHLQSLNLQGCLFLGDLPDSIHSLSTLENFEGEDTFLEDKVEEFNRKLNLQASYELDVGSSDLWSQIVDFEKTLCHKLIVKHLEKLKHLGKEEQAKLSSNLKLTKLELSWEHGKESLVENASTDKLVLEKLVPPRCLQLLHLEGYMSIGFPSWMLDIASYLPHLTMIHLHHLKGCNHLPPLGRLPNIRVLCMSDMPSIKSIGREFYGNYGSCQKLRMILLRSMDNLEEWWTTRSSNEDGEFLIPNLHLLAVEGCPKLKFVPYPPRSMCWLLARNSDHVLPEQGFGNLSSTTSPFSLHIHSIPSSEGWRRARYLSSLEHIHFHYIRGLRTLPEDIQCFTSLRCLEIEDCDDLETLPEWLGGLTSLREIIIKDCWRLSSLPESMQSLTGLDKLRIVNCPALAEKCQGEDKHKITHIPKIEYE